jgi:signal transduction histidine kinase
MADHQPTMGFIEFDGDLVLSDILTPRLMDHLDKVIKEFGIGEYAIISTSQDVLAGTLEPMKSHYKLPLAPELEPIGFLYLPEIDPCLAQGIHKFLVMMIQSEWRYHMASDIHLKAIKADYEALKEKHQLLQQSEAQYKELSESLDLKVKEQISTIESTQRKLYQAEKLASVGQLAAGMAHEINNPIGFIHSNLKTANDYLSELLEWYKQLPDNVKQAAIQDILEDFPLLLNECLEGSDRVRQIVADLKAYSNIDYTETRRINLRDTIERVVRIFSTQHNKQIDVQMDIDDDLHLTCFSGYINQMLLNVLSNAANAIAEAGKITIRGFRQEQQMIICIADDGRGMTESIISRAFDPFFTTQDVGKGVGLGLTVARDIARKHNGDIELTSELERGTRVTITLQDIN